MLVLFLKSIVKILYILFKINKHFYIFVNYYNNKIIVSKSKEIE
jgi:hypothetical protein